MSHPIPTHDYAEETYESHSPHKDGHYSSRAKALKKAKLNKTQKMTARWLNDAGKTLPKKGENHLQHINRLMK